MLNPFTSFRDKSFFENSAADIQDSRAAGEMPFLKHEGLHFFVSIWGISIPFSILNVPPSSWTTSVPGHPRWWLHPLFLHWERSLLFILEHEVITVACQSWPLLTASEFTESRCCMTWNNNSSAPAHKVLKRPMFSPEGNLQNLDMSPKMKYRFSKVLYSKFWGLTRFDYILDVCSFNNCWRAVGEILLWLHWGVSRWKRAHSRMWSFWRIVTISHDDRAIWPQRNAFLSFFILPISNSTVIWYLSCARYSVRCQ